MIGLVAGLLMASLNCAAAPQPGEVQSEAPGLRRRIGIDDLPPPYATPSAGNPVTIVPRPPGAWPRVPDGFAADLVASGLDGPRQIRFAPNGDLFVVESQAGTIRILASASAGDGGSVYATGLDAPSGIAFYPPGSDPRYLYVGTPGAVLRFAYRSGDRRAHGGPSRVAVLPNDGRGHWTRDLQFSLDGRTLYVGVGSASNVAEPGSGADETLRADILAFDPDGSRRRVYASGLRNPSGLAIDPRSGALWCVVNERDGLGDDLVPDYATRVQKGGFYGWPQWYLGSHPDPRHAAVQAPTRAAKVIVPDVLLQAHSAPLQIAFYRGDRFPEAYRRDAFATSHGSWNRSVRTGYKVVRIRFEADGRADGSYEDFVTGFVLPDGTAWGRPVGIAVGPDGSMFVSDDASGSIWRIRYETR